MNKIIYVLIFITAFLTGNYLLLLAVPIMAWIYSEKKRKKKATSFKSPIDLINMH